MFSPAGTSENSPAIYCRGWIQGFLHQGKSRIICG